MLGHLAVAGDVLGAGDLVGEDGGEQVFRLHPLQLRRDLLAAGEARQGERGGRVPAPAHGEERRVEQRLDQDVERGRRMEVAHHLVERKAVAGRERQDDRVLGRRRLDLEVEAAAEALAQRQAPGAVEAAAERRMDDQLHAARGVEEALDDDPLLRRQRAEDGERARQVVDDLARALVVEAGRGDQRERRRVAAVAGDARADLVAQARDRERQLVAAAGRFAEPERDARRRAVRVLDPDPAGLDAQDAVARVAELEHVAGDALDREVLVDRADVRALRLEDDGVVAGLGNRPARGQRGQARALLLAQDVMDGVAMDVARARPVARREAVGEHAHDGVEVGAREPRVRPGAADEREQRVLVPFAARGLGDDLLREDVERRRHDAQRIELAAADRIEQRRALDQLVARLREEARLGNAADGVARAAGALQEGRDRARRAELADQVDVADVEAELERRGRDQHLQFAALQALLGVEPRFLGEAAVVRRDRVLAEALAEVARGALGHAPRVDEDQRRPVQMDQLGDAAVDLLPLVVRHHRRERRRRQLEREVALLGVADVDDLAIGLAVDDRAGADQEARDLVDRLLRRRQADPNQRLGDDRLQPLEREREVAAALARGDGVDLVDDHGANAGQHRPARDRAEQDVKRLGRRHQDVRRLLQALAPLDRRRVAGAHGGADRDVGQAERAQLGADAGERRLEVGADVVRERLQRRDVDDRRLVGEAARREAGAHQAVERGQERGQRLARAGRCRDQRVPAGADRRPGGRLRLGGRGKGPGEPAGDGGMEVLERHGTILARRRRGRAADAAARAMAARRGRTARGQARAAKVKAGSRTALRRAPAARPARPGCRGAAAKRRRSRSPWPARRRRPAPAPRRRRAPPEPPSPARSP